MLGGPTRSVGVTALQTVHRTLDTPWTTQETQARQGMMHDMIGGLHKHPEDTAYPLLD